MKLLPKHYVYLAWLTFPVTLAYHCILVLRNIYFEWPSHKSIDYDEILPFILGSMMIMVGLASIIPFFPMRSKKSILLYLPILIIPIYGLYEWTMPARMDIRVDLLFLFPGLAIVIVATVFRWIAIYRKSYIKGDLGALSICAVIFGIIGVVFFTGASYLALSCGISVLLSRERKGESSMTISLAKAGVITGSLRFIMFFLFPYLDMLIRSWAH